jgi:TPP-dependent 2-oxoacid decarboxylase
MMDETVREFVESCDAVVMIGTMQTDLTGSGHRCRRRSVPR